MFKNTKCQSSGVATHDKEDEISSSATEELHPVFDEAPITIPKSDKNQSTQKVSSDIMADVRTQQSVSILITDTSNAASNNNTNFTLREPPSTSNVTLTPSLHNETVHMHAESTQTYRIL